MRRILPIFLLAISAHVWGFETPRFDYYLLSLSLAPAFCEDEPQKKRGFAQCRALVSSVASSLPLSLHGLWPNRRDGHHPQDCGGGKRGRFCSLPAVSLQTGTRARLGRAMPATPDCLDRYEWAKHGSCSGLSADNYFTVSITLTERLNQVLGAELTRHAGREVNLETLRQALAKSDPALLESVVFNCQTPRTPNPNKRHPMLTDVRVYFERNAASSGPGGPLDYRRAGVKNFNSGCPGGWAYVDSPLD